MKTIEIGIPDGKRAEWINGVLTLVDEKPQDITKRIKTFGEVYAVRCDNLFGFTESNSKKAKYLYRIFIDERCERCGNTIRTITSPMRRTELLKQSWFILPKGGEK